MTRILINTGGFASNNPQAHIKYIGRQKVMGADLSILMIHPRKYAPALKLRDGMEKYWTVYYCRTLGRKPPGPLLNECIVYVSSEYRL